MKNVNHINVLDVYVFALIFKIKLDKIRPDNYIKTMNCYDNFRIIASKFFHEIQMQL